MTGRGRRTSVEYHTRGKHITVYECRPPWQPDLGPDSTRQPVAQLRYDPSDHHWRLYCADRNGRWRFYEPAKPTPRLDELIAEIDADRTGIVWG